ncbi:specifically androgen-regulated gene protein [Cyprinodon tularosa]|uniref:specifically androgen-regulated gene protein n=1 Tax=Cyprinodon tularosa TaxID=77115 RepID=UPI0018E2171E|nr:specifically androgen-regulated gene protein [Cyprinodon tularosa]
MPKSDTWPGGTEPETMNGMESAGSCDSVVSANSGFSDDSLEHLSAEEKACLMFLEETIESLDNEDDSGVSHDEPERLSGTGNLAARLSDRSVSMRNSNVHGSEKPDKQPIKKNIDTKHKHSYLVPTPFVVASGSQSSLPGTKALTASSQSQLKSKSKKLSPGHNQKRSTSPVPVVQPSAQRKENSAKPAEGPLPRGPLSYDALVHLRRNASQKKTPLCPSVDHTIDLNRQCPLPVEGQKFGNATKSGSEVYRSKTDPPAVPPKPPKKPANIVQNEEPITADMSERVKHATNPDVVRQEALQRLGLLKDHKHKDGAPPHAKPHSKKTAKDPSDPKSSSSQKQPDPKSRPLRKSTGVYWQSKEEQQPVLLLHVKSQPSGSKTEGLERSVNQNPDSNSRKHPEAQHIPCAKPMKTTSQPSSGTPGDSVAYTTMVVPGMGSDREEALRKLGLLKS